MWESSTLPKEMICTMLVLTPKVNPDTRGIGLLEVICKLLEAIIYTGIKMVVIFHNVLHGFRSKKGVGATIMGLNMV